MKNKIIYFSAAILVLFILFSWFFWDEYAASKIAPFQKTEGWNQWEKVLPEGQSTQELRTDDPRIPAEKKPGIFLRIDSNTNYLLLKHSYAKEVYSYNPETEEVKQVAENAWSEADGNITICKLQGPTYNLESTVETYPVYTVKHKGKVLETYGKYGLLIKESPSHTKAAILSAYGPSRGSSGGLLGLGGRDPVVYGRRYVQIMQLNEKRYIQDPVRLIQADGKHEFNLCWSEDERYIVAFQPYENISIIKTNIDTK